MKPFLSILIAGILLSGCCKQCLKRYPQQEVVKDSIIHDTVERIKDSMIYVEPDRAYLKAWVECDENGKLLMKRIEQYEAGKRTTPKVVVRDNYVELECDVDTAKILSLNREKIIRGIQVKEKLKVVEIPKMNGYQTFAYWAFHFLAGIAILVLVIRTIIRSMKP